MDFGLVSVSLLIIAAVLILVGLKLLIKRNYFIQFLRGFAGFGLLSLAFIIIMSGLNIASYSQLSQGEQIANISFKKVNNQNYDATVVNVQTGEQSSFNIDGDMWQVDARVLKLFLSSTPFYKLERISGRYYSLDQERTNNRSVYPLTGQSMGFDLWSIFKGSSIGLLSASYGSATYLPMADDAVFTVSIGSSGLVSKPVNTSASAIVNEWQ